MPTLFDDLRQALRALLRSPGFALTAALTLALGIGATTTLVSALDRLVLRAPPGVEAPQQIVRAYLRYASPQIGEYTNASTSWPDYQSLLRAKSLSAVAAVYNTYGSLGRGAESRPVRLQAVTGNYFGMLGTRSVLGRTLLPEDDREDAEVHALVLSEHLWRTHFDHDPAIIGRTIPIDDVVYTVVGVAPAEFDGGSYNSPDGWVGLTPMGIRGIGPTFRTEPGWNWLQMVARVAPGYSSEQARTEATAMIVAGRDSAHVRGFREAVFGPVQEARGPSLREDSRIVYWLAGVSLVVLLIACANVANLQLVRGLGRSRELAVRKALGGGTGRLVFGLMLEGVWLALLAGGLGLLACLWGGDLLRSFVLPAGMAETFRLDARLIALAVLASAIAGLLSSLLPAFQTVRGDLTPVLKDGARGTGFRTSRLQSTLVVLQVGLSILLVVGAGLFIQSLRNMRAIDIGYDRDNIVMVVAAPRSAGFDGVGTARAFEAMAAAARGYPGVTAVSLTYGEPFGWSMGRGFSIPGMDSLPDFSSGGPYVQAVTPEYFKTVGLGILAGNGFAESDRREHPRVALMGTTMARRYFGEPEKALGRCLKLEDEADCTSVIGVVEDGIRYDPREGEQAIYYIPLPPGDSATSHLTMFVRTHGKAGAIVPGLRAALQTAVPGLPYVQARSLEEVLSPRYQTWQLGAELFTLFGTVALVLAALGIFSVLSYAVRGRTRELGIRLALGALPASLLALVVRDGLRLTLLGVGLGIAGALAAGRAMGSLVYGVSTHDVPTMLLAGGTVIAVAALASLLPARRAAKVDPMQSLRSE